MTEASPEKEGGAPRMDTDLVLGGMVLARGAGEVKDAGHATCCARLGAARDARWIAELGDSLAERIAGPFGERSMHRRKKPAPAGIASRSRHGQPGWWRRCEGAV